MKNEAQKKFEANSPTEPTKPLFWALLFAMLGVHLFHMYLASKVSFSYGDDAFLSHSMGKDIVDNFTGIKKFLNSLVSGFLFEDHLMPLTVIYGIVLYLLSSDAGFIFPLFSKFVVLCSTLLSIRLAWEILRSRLQVLIFAFLIIFNISLHWRSIILNFQSQGTVPWGILAAIFLHRYWNGEKNKDLSLFILFSACSFYSFETALLIYAYMAFYCVSNWYFDSESSNFKTRFQAMFSWKSPQTRKLLIAGTLLTLSITPYLIIHQSIFGFPIPAERNPSEFSLLNYISNFSLAIMGSFFHDISLSIFGIHPWIRQYGILLVASFLLLFSRRLKIFDLLAWKFFANFIFLSCIIAFTKRFDPGLWPFSGIVIALALARPLSNALIFLTQKFKPLFNNELYFICLFLAVLTALATYKQTKVLAFKYNHSMYERYNVMHDQTTALAHSMGRAQNRFKIFRLEKSKLPMDNYYVLWMSSRLSYQASALVHYPEHTIFHLPDQSQIETYDIDGNFADIVPAINASLSANENVVIKNKNSYSAVFWNHKEKLLYRNMNFLKPKDNQYRIYLPHLDFLKAQNENLKFILKFKDNKTKLPTLNIFLANKKVAYRSLEHNQIEFNWSMLNELKFESLLKVGNGSKDELQLESISVYSKQKLPPILNENRSSYLTLHSGQHPCFFSVVANNQRIKVDGVLAPGKSTTVLLHGIKVTDSEYLQISSRAITIPRQLNGKNAGLIQYNQLIKKENHVELCKL